MFSFTALLSRRRTRYLDAQWQLRTGVLKVLITDVNAKTTV